MRTLLVQTSFLGDSLLSTPVIEGVHRFLPDTELWTLSTPLSRVLFARDPLVHTALAFDKRKEHKGIMGLERMLRTIRALKFERALVLHRSWRTAFLMGLSGIRERVGFEEAALPWVFHRRVSRGAVPAAGPTRHEVERNLAILTPFGDVRSLSQSLRVHPLPLEGLSDSLRRTLMPLSSYVVLVPGSVWETKRWSPRRYQELAQRLERDGSRVVLVGAPDERDTANQVAADTHAINLVGQTSVEECVSIIAGARGVVCNDSFALHVASAVRVPTVAVFCATSPEFGFGPWQNPLAAVVEREGLTCKPCSRHGQRRCPLATNQCMEEVPSSQVYAMLQQRMDSSIKEELHLGRDGGLGT